jgi:hypothetical protein
MAASDWMGFGISRKTGKMVGVEDVPRGKACDCICAECGGVLVARQGQVRAWGFAHLASGVDCAGAAETALHRMAKQLVAGWQEISLPELKVTEVLEGRFERHEETSALPGRHVEIESGQAEVDLKSFRPDALLRATNGEWIAVEIHVSHPVDQEKGERVRVADQTMVEFDLSRLPRYGISTADLDKQLRQLVPKWIHHPAEAALRAELRRKLEKKAAELEAARRRRLDSSAQFRRPEKSRRSPEWGDYDPPSKPVELLATFWCCDVELLVKTHPLLEGVTIWAARSHKASRSRALCEVATIIRSKGVACSSHTAYLGYLIAWGEGGRKWADSLAAEGPAVELRLDSLAVSPTVERL